VTERFLRPPSISICEKSACIPGRRHHVHHGDDRCEGTGWEQPDEIRCQRGRAAITSSLHPCGTCRDEQMREYLRLFQMLEVELPRILLHRFGTGRGLRDAEAFNV
jgi:hypothetical protein